MKHCPACNFSFPDFHRVCDFDGTELIPDPDRPSLVNASLSPSRFRRACNSPMLLTSLAIVALFLSALLIGYFESATEVSPVVKTQPTPQPSISIARTSEQDPTLIKTPVPAKRRNLNALPQSSGSPRRQATARSSQARLNQKTSIGNRPQESDLAGRKDARSGESPPPQISDKKAPRLTAILKTTWNILKKPFKF